jgi:hypothetical protein
LEFSGADGNAADGGDGDALEADRDDVFV